MNTTLKICFLTGLAAMLLPAHARAEFSFFCGEQREKGVEQAEISFVDSLEAPMKLFLDGKEVPDEKLGFKAKDNSQWIVSVDRGEGNGSRKFVFTQHASASVEEFSVNEKGDEKRAGAKKACRFHQKKAE